jgi:hypothetical protein
MDRRFAARESRHANDERAHIGEVRGKLILH